MKYLWYTLFVISLILLVSAFFMMTTDEGLASFILAASGVVLAFLSLLKKPKQSVIESENSNKTSIKERISNPDSQFKALMQFVVIGIIIGVVYGLTLDEIPSQYEAVFDFLLLSNSVIFAKILFGILYIVSTLIEFYLLLLFYGILLYFGFRLALYAFNTKNRIIQSFFGAVSSSLSIVIAFTVFLKISDVFGDRKNAHFSEDASYLLIVSAAVVGFVMVFFASKNTNDNSD